MNRLAIGLVLALGAAACGADNRNNPGGSTGAPASAAKNPEKLEAFATELAAITGTPPAPTPTLSPAVAVTSKNTLVIAADALALLRKETGASTVRTPERSPLVDLLVQLRGGQVQNPIVLTDASEATALRSIDELTYIAVVEERAWIAPFSRSTIAIWDRAAKAYEGTLWVTLPLTEAPDKEMAMFRGSQQVGPSFTVSEQPGEREVRHRAELRVIVQKAINERAQQWISPSGYDSPGDAFSPATDKPFNVPLPSAPPALGPADAKVVVQIFTQLGDDRVALVAARIAQTYGDRVRIVWRDYPHSFLKDSEPAAQAAREIFAANGAPAFWDYVALIAAEHPHHSPMPLDTLVQLAERQGNDGARIRAAMDAHTHKAAINADVAALKNAKLPVKPTSASFVNGFRVPSAISFGDHATRIDALL